MQGNADSWAPTIPLRHREEVAPRAPTERLESTVEIPNIGSGQASLTGTLQASHNETL